MKKFKISEFMFEVFSLIVIVIIVQGFYATVVRPQAAAVAASDAAQMAKDPNFAPARNFYIIIKDYEQEAEIVLNAVHPGAQRTGLYGALVEAALGWARRAGASKVVVSTQVNNVAPQRAWVRHGFEPACSLHTFHLWSR